MPCSSSSLGNSSSASGMAVTSTECSFFFKTDYEEGSGEIPDEEVGEDEVEEDELVFDELVVPDEEVVPELPVLDFDLDLMFGGNGRWLEELDGLF